MLNSIVSLPSLLEGLQQGPLLGEEFGEAPSPRIDAVDLSLLGNQLIDLYTGIHDFLTYIFQKKRSYIFMEIPGDSWVMRLIRRYLIDQSSSIHMLCQSLSSFR